MKLTAIMVGLCLVCPGALAKNTSCAKELRAQSKRVWWAIAIFSMGPGLTWIPEAKKYKKEAKVLEAASALKHLNDHNNNRVQKARRHLQRYYNKLVALYPGTLLSFDEVVDALDDVNQTGTTTKFCSRIKPRDEDYGTRTLKIVLFTDGELTGYRAFKEAHQIET